MSEDTLKVIIERIQNLKEYTKLGFEDIKETSRIEHQAIKDRQDITNGSVRKNNEWRLQSKAVIGFIIIALLPIAFLVIRQVI